MTRSITTTHTSPSNPASTVRSVSHESLRRNTRSAFKSPEQNVKCLHPNCNTAFTTAARRDRYAVTHTFKGNKVYKFSNCSNEYGRPNLRDRREKFCSNPITYTLRCPGSFQDSERLQHVHVSSTQSAPVPPSGCSQEPRDMTWGQYSLSGHWLFLRFWPGRLCHNVASPTAVFRQMLTPSVVERGAIHRTAQPVLLVSTRLSRQR